MELGQKIKINNQIMFYNGGIPGDLQIKTRHVLVSNRRKVGTSAHDMVLGDRIFWDVVRSGKLEYTPFLSERLS